MLHRSVRYKSINLFPNSLLIWKYDYFFFSNIYILWSWDGLIVLSFNIKTFQKTHRISISWTSQIFSIVTAKQFLHRNNTQNSLSLSNQLFSNDVAFAVRRKWSDDLNNIEWVQPILYRKIRAQWLTVSWLRFFQVFSSVTKANRDGIWPWPDFPHLLP